ncbi:putative hemoglobin and hemoglobin-haptoglobin-binding protein 3 precursor [Lacticaseibacillus paracasei]|uniref:LPXTG cell wall anchor domain-containing protein n=1 Tax=Lacticaseibacillus paracasei TaxID=1597 RepID=UPI000F0B1C2B|nr:LPXTG cell wall anchor domain-containing protein [Lacticaseibacillus paracasei]RNE43419.1 putative hemoglobin and hemoglobin-haptoglobin-binding protein 3 precursor [Lacticaseibacillus paracasei]
MEKRSVTAQWKKALLISTALLGGAAVSTVASQLVPAQQVLAASGRIAIWDDQSNSAYGFSTMVTNGNLLVEDIPSGYHAAETQDAGVSVQGNQFVIDTSVNGSGSYRVHVLPDDSSATTIGTFGVIYSRDSSSGRLIGITTASVTGSYILSIDVPEGYRPSADQDAGISVRGNQVLIDTQVNPSTNFYVNFDPIDGPTEETTAPTATPTVAPTTAPTVAPTAAPTTAPTVAPTAAPTTAPTVAPTAAPTTAPTVAPTAAPTTAPTVAPTAAPTTAPTVAPTAAPTVAPTVAPTSATTVAPTSTSTATTRPVPVAVTKAIDSSASTVKSKPNTIAAKSEEQRFPETGEENNSGTALAGLALLTTATASLFGISMKRKRRN